MAKELVKNNIDVLLADLPPDIQTVVANVSYLTSKIGMSLEEACILSDTIPAWLDEQAKMYPIIDTTLSKKKIEYKRDLLKVISDKAVSGDDKMAQWLLERTYPEEYSAKRQKASSDESDSLAMAIEFVQKHSNDTPLVKQTSGRAMIIKKGNIKEEDVVEKIKKLLE